MTSDEFRARLAYVESEANRLSYIDDNGCALGDYWTHARSFMDHLTWFLEADYYGVARPQIESGCLRLDERIVLGIQQAEANWSGRRWNPLEEHGADHLRR